MSPATLTLITVPVPVLDSFLSGLYPTDPVEAMKVDHWMDVIGDWTKYVMLTYGGAKSNFISDTEWTEAERMAVGQRAIDTALPKVHAPDYHCIADCLVFLASGFFM
jgi:hypothetical protein